MVWRDATGCAVPSSTNERPTRSQVARRFGAVTRALVLNTGNVFHSERAAFPEPSVVRLSYFVKVPYQARVALNRRAVFARDGHRCQYCGAAAENIDHVIPRSKGGPHTWENVVAACRPCNSR